MSTCALGPWRHDLHEPLALPQLVNQFVLSLQGCVKAGLRRLGYELRWVPRSLRRHPQGEVRLTLDHIVAHRMALVEDFFFIQIGAFDGSSVDPVGELARRHHWRGILIEPQPEAFAALQKTYSGQPGLIFVQAAITRTCGTVDFYQVQPGAPGLPSKAPLIASLDREMVVRNLGGAPDLAAHVRKIAVPAWTLDALAAAHDVKRVDLLQIDAEGHDLEIMRTIDFSRLRPAIINYEHALLSAAERDAAWDLLLRKGYRIFVHEPDTTAVACDSP